MAPKLLEQMEDHRVLEKKWVSVIRVRDRSRHDLLIARYMYSTQLEIRGVLQGCLEM